MHLLRWLTAFSIILFSRLVTAVRGFWPDGDARETQAVYFANHTSNGDFILLWTVLPTKMRKQTRPVAGSDYWLTTRLKKFIGKDVFNAVLIDRNSETRTADPVTQMSDALKDGSSLILFPEGTRNTTKERLLPFKPGLFHLAKQCPDVSLVPVWIQNLNRVLPKGEIIPVPFICTVHFGEGMMLQPDEDKEVFLERARQAMLDLDPEQEGTI